MRYHKFKHNFQDSLNPLCNCDLKTESTSHYLLHCHLFADERKAFLSNIKRISDKFLEKNDSTLTYTLLFSDPASTVEINTLLLNATIQYVLPTQRFEEAFYSLLLKLLLCIFIFFLHSIRLFILLLLLLVTLNKILATCIFN